VRDELRGELGEVDLVNVHLLLFDEIKEQVERAFKNFELKARSTCSFISSKRSRSSGPSKTSN
jgi:hypothetical protein